MFIPSFANPQLGWAAGAKHAYGEDKHGIILHTKNGGISWAEQVSDNKLAGMDSIFFLNAKSGWAAGDDDTILHTEDGGTTWVTQTTYTTQPLLSTKGAFQAVTFATEQSGWAVGYYGGIVHTVMAAKPGYGKAVERALICIRLSVETLTPVGLSATKAQSSIPKMEAELGTSSQAGLVYL